MSTISVHALSVMKTKNKKYWRSNIDADQCPKESIVYVVSNVIFELLLGERHVVKEWTLEQNSKINTERTVCETTNSEDMTTRQKKIPGIESMLAQVNLEPGGGFASSEESSTTTQKKRKTHDSERDSDKEVPVTSPNTNVDPPALRFHSIRSSTQMSSIDWQSDEEADFQFAPHSAQSPLTMRPKLIKGAKTAITVSEKPQDLRTMLIESAKAMVERKPGDLNYHKERNTQNPPKPSKAIDQAGSSIFRSSHSEDGILSSGMGHNRKSNSKVKSSRTLRQAKDNQQTTNKIARANEAKYPKPSHYGESDDDVSSFYLSDDSSPDPQPEESTQSFLSRISKLHNITLDTPAKKAFDIQADFDTAKPYDGNTPFAKRLRARLFPGMDQEGKEKTVEKGEAGKNSEKGGKEKTTKKEELDSEDEDWETVEKPKGPRKGLSWREELDWKLMSSWRKHEGLESFW
ncbi:uncharacterized protein LY89DRAFT_723295 [Mollisia scopiformis]|uniref:Uncharacterized protein n=1 Tax=Mollisia scopiformis TaxID=149040 RepID=A0A194WRT3_MOLSC|nr:uncharacterized protein LY89DRAFT_723295 [Mollisia scopiformis]KUJ10701.1 hypothetical protein LY89DRAFT_723295 [Mollisia scopiformis]